MKAENAIIIALIILIFGAAAVAYIITESGVSFNKQDDNLNMSVQLNNTTTETIDFPDEVTGDDSSSGSSYSGSSGSSGYSGSGYSYSSSSDSGSQSSSSDSGSDSSSSSSESSSEAGQSEGTSDTADFE